MTIRLSAPSADKPAARRNVYYPTRDGKPIAEDPIRRHLTFYGCEALESYFRERADVYVSGNDFIYYEEGNPKARVSPDCYVVIGVPKQRRRPCYKVWEEGGIAPSVVLEFTSKKTRREDMEIKKPLYEQVLQVAEYFQFDPTGDYLRPHLQGYRLQEGQYQPIELRDNRMHSEQLGLGLVMEGEALHFYDPARGACLLTYAEIHAELQAQAHRADSYTRRAEAAEAKLTRLRAENEALRQQR